MSFSPVKLYIASLAILLMFVSGWQGGASILRLYGHADRDGLTMDAPQLLTAISSLQRSDDWFWDPNARTRAGLLEFQLSLNSRSGTLPNAGNLDNAIEDILSGLVRAPADAWAWTMLARAELIAGNFSMGVRVFREALLAALYEPSLTVWRSQLGVALWPMLSNEDRNLVASQIRMAWTRHPQDVLALAKASADNIARISSALDQDFRQRVAFEEALKH